MSRNLILTALIFAFGAVAYAAPVPAPEPLTLEKAMDEAVTESPDVRKAQADAGVASWRRLEALSAHLPHLSISGEHLLSAEYQILSVNFGGSTIQFPAAFPQTTASFDASILLFDGLSSIDRYRASLLGNEAAELELSRARFQVVETVRQKFYQALASQILLGVAEQNIKSLEDHLTLAQAMVKSGYSTRFDVLRIEAELEEARAARLLAVDNATLARRALSLAMGESGEDARPLAGELPVPRVAEVPADLSLDTAKRDDLEAQQKREEAADLASSAASRFWVPKVSLFGEKMYYKFGNFNPAILPSPSFQGAYTVGLRLSWNLFDGGESLARAKEASYASDKDRETTRAALLAAPEEFELWKRRFTTNTALYEARERTVEKSEESVRLAQLGLKAGTRTSTEWLDAELELFRARAGVVQAQVDALDALTRLELATGRKLAAE